MSERQRAAKAVSLIALGCVFIYFDFKLNFTFASLNLLPDFAGYFIVLGALKKLSERSKSASLLIPLCVILALFDAAMSVASFFVKEPHIPIVSIIVSAADIYFHFQLLTIAADIARDYSCPQHGRLIDLRNVRTVAFTMLYLITNQPIAGYIAENRTASVIISVVTVIILFIFMIWTVATLFRLKKALLKASDEEEDADA